MATEIQRQELEIRGHRTDIRRWAYELTRTTNETKKREKLGYIETTKQKIREKEAALVDLRKAERDALASKAS